MGSIALPKFIVLKAPQLSSDTCVYCKDDGSIVDGDDSMFSPLVKIEVERANVNNKYVHLRFCHSNKYWQKRDGDNSIVAVSNKTEEDTAKSSCTLFEPRLQSDDLYFTHVQTGRGVTTDYSTSAFYISNTDSASSPLTFVDWETLIKLPGHVAFKGDNGRYLRVHYDTHKYLQFSSYDPNDSVSRHQVSLMRDGHVRIKSDDSGSFWRRSPNWIWADSDDMTADDRDTLFWPIKIDENTIALRNAGNDKFCQRLTTDGMESCLNAAVSSLTTETRLQVQELVAERKIVNVRYRMEDARIYGERPYMAGTTTVTNFGDEVASIAVEITHTKEMSSSFNRSVSITAGVTCSITAGLPGIGEGGIQIMTQISTALEWNTTKTSSTEVKATGTVSVPARSVAVVNYVGTKGTCDVPFSYTQHDRSSVNGEITLTDQIDGVYTGVNAYNFSFSVEKARPL